MVKGTDMFYFCSLPRSPFNFSPLSVSSVYPALFILSILLNFRVTSRR